MSLETLKGRGVPDSAWPDIANRYAESPLLLIAGSARCVWQDIKTFYKSNLYHDVMCVNDVGMHFPGRVDHWYSNDSRMIQRWRAARRPRYTREHDREMPPVTHSCFGGADYRWPWPGHGSSGLNAVYTGLALGYQRIVLAGIPLDNSGHYFDPPWVKGNFVSEVPDRKGAPKYWQMAAREVFHGRVRSMSGRTADLLGVFQK